jgi:DnaK suppressor protein
MTSRQREELRRELIERLTGIYCTVRHDLSEVIVEAAVERDPEDEADEGVEAELHALAAQMSERDRLLAHQIEDALRRMHSDEYGICIDCGREIPIERLRVVPWALRCADDQERVERTGRPTFRTL